jgi:hypothetical protein
MIPLTEKRNLRSETDERNRRARAHGDSGVTVLKEREVEVSKETEVPNVAIEQRVLREKRVELL